MEIIEKIDHDIPKPICLKVKNKINRNLILVVLKKEALIKIQKHSYSEINQEVVGFLLGKIFYDIKLKLNITYIEETIPGLYESSQTHYRLLPNSFLNLFKFQEKKNLILVGYYHSHPEMSVFLSSIDMENFKKFYSKNYNVSIVIAPSKKHDFKFDIKNDLIGFFVWEKGGNLVRLNEENILIVDNLKDISKIKITKSNLYKYNKSFLDIYNIKAKNKIHKNGKI